MSYVVPKSACPHCGLELQSAESLGDNPTPPKPGDLSICGRCTALLVITPEWTRRLLSLEELHALHPSFRFQIRAIQRQLVSRN